MFEINSYDANGDQIYYFTQWDLNRKLVLYLPDYDLSIIPEVHFCNKKSDEALVVKSATFNKEQAIIVDVPNILLQEAYPISAYVYVANKKDDEQKTIVATTIVVNARVKPANYIYEDNVDYYISQIEERIYQRLVEYFSSNMPVATEISFGGIKASVKTDTETVEVKIGTDGKLYVPETTSGIINETDPTVPAWAKNPTKPSYTKDEIGLDNVDNVKQYSAVNPPPYPVTSVNGQTGDIEISIPLPTETSLGGIMASAKTENDTVEVKLGSNGRLYVAPIASEDGTGNVFIDSTLTQSGMAADAAIVGTKITDIEEEISTLKLQFETYTSELLGGAS